MTAQLAIFFVLAALAVLGALNLIIQRHPIHSALSLIVVMVALAGLYLLMGAEFVAAVQIIVYGGAIMVLFVFVIMLLNAGVEEHTNVSKLAGIAGIPLAVALLGFLAVVIARSRTGAASGHAIRRAGQHERNFDHALPGICLSFRADFVPHSRGDFGRDCPGAAGEKLEMVPTSYYLILSAVLFGLGVVAFIFKRNVITIFMSIELMLNAVNLAFVAFSQARHQSDGQVFVLFVIVVAAAEAAVGLGIIILTARNRQSLNVERVDLLKL